MHSWLQRSWVEIGKKVNLFPYNVYRDHVNLLKRGIAKSVLFATILIFIAGVYSLYLFNTEQSITHIIGNPLSSKKKSDAEALWTRLDSSLSYECPCREKFLCAEVDKEMDISLVTATSPPLNSTLRFLSNKCQGTPTFGIRSEELANFYHAVFTDSPDIGTLEWGAMLLSGVCMVSEYVGQSNWKCVDLYTLVQFCQLKKWALAFQEITDGSSHFGGLIFRYSLPSVSGTAEKSGSLPIIESIRQQHADWHKSNIPDASSFPSVSDITDPSYLRDCGVPNPSHVASMFATSLPHGGYVWQPISDGNYLSQNASAMSAFVTVNMPDVLLGCAPTSCTIVERPSWETIALQTLGIIGGLTTVVTIFLNIVVDFILDRLGIWLPKSDHVIDTHSPFIELSDDRTD